MRIDFVVAPFAEIQHPSLGVSNLTSLVRKMGHKSKVHYENLRFSERLGTGLYFWLSNSSINYKLMTGDFLFALLRSAPEARENMIERFLSGPVTLYLSDRESVRHGYRNLIQEVLPVLEEEALQAAEHVLEENPDVLGFTVGPFQGGAALCFAGIIRKRKPRIKIWFGGQSCMGSIGYAYLKNFPVLDAVFTGEAERPLKQVLECLEQDRTLVGIPGVLTRAGLELGRIRVPGDEVPELVTELDELPLPNFEDYFRTLGESQIADHILPYVVLEGSRGCWWAEQGPCRFCGLNIHTQRFRSKSPKRLMSELDTCKRKYGTFSVEMADNVLDPNYFDTLLPRLANGGPRVDLFVEVRPNLTREQVGLLKKAGVVSMQAGIEALDDEFLRLLRKGCRALDNIQLLKWCEEEEIILVYNHLYAIPGESVSNYERIIERMAILHHFRPPNPGPVRLDRYSIYGDEPEKFGIKPLGPWSASLAHCYPEAGKDVEELSYHFRFAFLPPGANHHSWWFRFLDEVEAWAKDYYRQEKRLLKRNIGTQTFIEDNRFSKELETFELRPEEAAALEACDQAVTESEIMAHCRGTGYSPGKVFRAVDFLLDKKFILEMDGRLLGLAVSTDRWPTDLSHRKRRSFLKRSVTQVFENGVSSTGLKEFIALSHKEHSRKLRDLIGTEENREYPVQERARPGDGKK